MNERKIYDAIRRLPRARLVELIESVGAAAYDDEPVEDLVECVAESVAAGDLCEGDLV